MHIREPRPSGFTLLEVLIAAVVLGWSLLGLMTAFSVSYRDITYGGHVSEAVAMAHQKLEELKAGPFPPASGNQMGGLYTVTWSVTSVGFGVAPDDLRKVSVTVTWPQMTRTGRYEVVGFVSKPY